MLSTFLVLVIILPISIYRTEIMMQLRPWQLPTILIWLVYR